MGVRGLTSRISRRFVLILALAQLLLIYAWIIEPNWIEVTSHEAWFKNLPEEFNGLVVVHLSDLHMRKYGARERRVVARPAESTPGGIVLFREIPLVGADPRLLPQLLTCPLCPEPILLRLGSPRELTSPKGTPVVFLPPEVTPSIQL